MRSDACIRSSPNFIDDANVAVPSVIVTKDRFIRYQDCRPYRAMQDRVREIGRRAQVAR